MNRTAQRRAVAGVTALAMMVSGCATLTRSGRIGSDDGNDACRAYVVALDSSGNFFAEDMLRDAAIGAVSGAVIGTLASGGGGDTGRNALIGAVSGAVAGAALGYWQHKLQQGQDQAVLSVKGDLGREIEQMDKTNQAFSQLVDCRQAQFARIRNDVQSRALTRAQGEAQWAAQRQYLDRDLKLAALIDEDLVKRGQNFDFANQQVNGPLPPEPPPPPPPAPEPPARHKKAGKTKPPPAPPKPTFKEPEMAQLTATRQHKAGEFEAHLQAAKTLSQDTQSPGFTDSGWFDPLGLAIWRG